MKKRELYLIAALLLLAGVLWLGMRLLRPNDYGSIRITVKGAELGVWPLGEDQVIPIGDTNVCEIKDGTVRMTEADCPDHLCIKQGAIDQTGGMIVCLPNQVVIEAFGPKGGEPAVDGVM